MKCYQCGEELPFDADFCPHCGSRKVEKLRREEALKWQGEENRWQMNQNILLAISIFLGVAGFIYTIDNLSSYHSASGMLVTVLVVLGVALLFSGSIYVALSLIQGGRFQVHYSLTYNALEAWRGSATVKDKILFKLATAEIRKISPGQRPSRIKVDTSHGGYNLYMPLEQQERVLLFLAEYCSQLTTEEVKYDISPWSTAWKVALTVLGITFLMALYLNIIVNLFGWSLGGIL